LKLVKTPVPSFLQTLGRVFYQSMTDSAGKGPEETLDAGRANPVINGPYDRGRGKEKERANFRKTPTSAARQRHCPGKTYRRLREGKRSQEMVFVAVERTPFRLSKMVKWTKQRML
jgi:hypothetical protein